jgi:hypothetical protein
MTAKFPNRRTRPGLNPTTTGIPSSRHRRFCPLATHEILPEEYVDAALTNFVETKGWDARYAAQLRQQYLGARGLLRPAGWLSSDVSRRALVLTVRLDRAETRR